MIYDFQTKQPIEAPNLQDAHEYRLKQAVELIEAQRVVNPRTGRHVRAFVKVPGRDAYVVNPLVAS